MALEITETHRKLIEITCWMLDQLLCKFSPWVTKHEIHSIFYDELNTLSDKQCVLIKNEIIAIQLLLKNLKHEFGLQKHSEPIDKIIHATSTLFVTDELLPVQRYGVDSHCLIAPELNSYLDPKISEMINRLRNISKISGITK